MTAARSADNADNSDGRVRFSLSEDGMKLGISRYMPPKGHGMSLTADSIREQLKAAGVRQEPVPGAPERVIELLRAGKNYKGVVLARGLEPREPADAEIVPAGDIRFPAFPGQIVAKKLPPSQGEPGRTIDGRSIAPRSTTKDKKRDLAIQPGENCTYDDSTGLFVARVYGMVVIKEDSVHVVEGLAVSEDLTKLLGLIHYRDITGQAITPERFDEELARFDVSLPADEDSIKAAVKEAGQKRRLQREVAVVSGKEPQNGEDGWLEVLVKGNDEDPFGDEEEQEARQVDYRERGVMPTAKPGQHIALLHQPGKGVAGLDIYGRPIPAHSGKTLSILPGENVTALEGGMFMAKDMGLVVVERGVLMVTQVLVIGSDVDIGVGHVRAELGSVRVKGTVQSGMTVQAPKHIVVDQAVESATLEAGGDISVAGGILMPDGGEVRAEGDVTASFANNAIIHAGRDVTVTTSITNCRIHCEGMVHAVRGKGIVQGGEIHSRRGLEAKEVGTELGVGTTISVDIPNELDPSVAVARRKIKRELKRIEQAIGAGDPRDILSKTKPEKRKAVAEVIKHGMRLRKKLDAIDQSMAEMMEKRQEAMAAARIKVWTSIHPGVTIKIGGRVLNITRRIDRSQIYWHREERRIIIGRLGQGSRLEV